MGDRGFCARGWSPDPLASYAHLAMLHLRGVAACFRMHQRRQIDFRRGRPRRRLGPCDRVARWERPAQRPRWMSVAQFESMPAVLEVRELRYHIPRRGQRTLCVTIATTLLDPRAYPREKVAELYGLRWTVETHFAELKTTMGMRRLKSKTPAGVRKELAIFYVVYNLVHAVMVRAAARQSATPDRVSFIDALRWLLTAEPGEPLPDLVTNRRRPGRHEPRVIKDLRDTYRKMVLHRAAMKNQLDKWGGRPK